MLTLTVEHNYICFYIHRSLQQRHVLAPKNDIQPDTPGTMLPHDIMRS